MAGGLHGNAGVFMKSIVFLVYWPITAREVEVWGVEYLKTQGFNVEVFDLSLLLNGESLLKYPVIDSVKGDFIHAISSYQELESRLKQAAPHSFFVDFMVGLSGINLKTEKVFRLLKAYGARYFVVYGGALPFPSLSDNSSNLIEKVFGKIRKALNPKHLIDFIGRQAIFFLMKFTNIYPRPDKIFGGDSEILRHFIARYSIDHDRVIRIHSFDYDTYLKHVNRSACSETQPNERLCVFLDDAMTNHPDFAILKIRPLDHDKYYSSINRLFDRIEAESGLRVVIAAHPRSQYAMMPGVFGQREIIKGQTIELVAKSSMVLTHASTAVSFAVLFNKPILFVKTQEMVNREFSDTIDTIAGSLGLKAVNIDDDEILKDISLDYQTWPRDKYDDYRFKYIKSKDVGDAMVWEIVAEEINKEYINGHKRCC